VVEGVATRAPGYDVLRDLAAAGFKPVRELAQRDGFRFLEGLRTSAATEASTAATATADKRS
jgi:hypothetical protein